MPTDRETIAIILWWAEGTKSRRDKRWKRAVSYPVELTNTNPVVIKLFTDFLLYDLKIERSKLRIQIQIHEGDNQTKLEEYWSNISSIPLSQFNKTIIRHRGKKPGKTNGTCKVRFADKQVYMGLEERLRNALKDLNVPLENVLTLYEPGHQSGNLLE